MDDADVVRCLEGVRDLLRDRYGFTERQRPACDPRAEIFALNQLHRQRACGVGLFQPVHLRNVWMVERGQCPRLALEAHQTIGIVGEPVREDLERDIAPKPGVARTVDLTHSPGAERGQDFVRAKTSAGSQRQAR